MLKADAKKGMRVVFGKAKGEKTLGIIRKLNPTKAKVEILEDRGTKSEVGQEWGVPYAMMEPEANAAALNDRVTPKRAPGKVTKGMEFRSVIADCNALWKTIRPQGRGAWLCECVNEPIEIHGTMHEGEHAGTQKSFLDREILGSIGMDAMFKGVSDDTDDFYAKLNDGDIIHYCNGFGEFVRCEIAHNSKGEQYAKPIALVGNWKSSDLPTRYENGTVYNGYHAESILNPDGDKSKSDKAWKPNVSMVFEAPMYSRGNRDKNIDPRKLDPIDLTLPDMTPEEAETARLWQLVEKIKGLLDDGDVDNPTDRLNGAWAILNRERGKTKRK